MSKAQSTTRGPKPRAAAKRVAKRELVRGEAVVQRVLAATMEELALVGYRALRVEDVAARADVNKTTVYRRWPEKRALVRDALGCIADRKMQAPETGALRSDLLSIGRVMVEALELSPGPERRAHAGRGGLRRRGRRAPAQAAPRPRAHPGRRSPPPSPAPSSPPRRPRPTASSSRPSWAPSSTASSS